MTTAAYSELIESAKPIAAILDEMAEHSQTHAAAVMVDVKLIRALHDALDKIKREGGQ